MLDLKSGNNHAGWLHYFAAHLVCNCGVQAEELIATIASEAATVAEYDWQDRSAREMGEECDPKYRAPYISDNQLTMLGNRWFYTWNPIKHEFYMHDRNRHRRQILEPVPLNEEALEYWISYHSNMW